MRCPSKLQIEHYKSPLIVQCRREAGHNGFPHIHFGTTEKDINYEITWHDKRYHRNGDNVSSDHSDDMC